MGISSSASHRGKRKGRIRTVAVTLLPALTAALVLGLTTGATGAQALIVQLSGRALSYEPVPSTKMPHAKPLTKRPLEYHGGPVMPSNTNYTLYWDPAGAPEYPSGYQFGINRFFEDVAHDSGGQQNIESVLVQYGDKSGQFADYESNFAGELIDTDPYPANGCSAAPICLTDAQLRAEIVTYVETAGLPTGLEHEYFLLSPPGVESCFEANDRSCSAGSSHASYCSYHSFIPINAGVIVYANIPYMEGTNCDTGEEHPNDNPSDATIGGGMAHEQAESITDPELNAWYDAKGEEVADKCRTFKVATEFGEPLGKAPDGSNYNQVINGDLYWFQQVWSNSVGGCVQRAAQAPTVTKLSPKNGSETGGTLVTITGTSLTGATRVSFGSASATEVTVKSSTVLSAVSPKGSAGSVNITVTTPNGTSAITKKDQFKYKKAK